MDPDDDHISHAFGLCQHGFDKILLVLVAGIDLVRR